MIDSREKLEAWLKGRPAEYAQVIAARAALRALTNGFSHDVPDILRNKFSIGLFGSAFFSWVATYFQATDISNPALAAAQRTFQFADQVAANQTAEAVFSAASCTYATLTSNKPDYLYYSGTAADISARAHIFPIPAPELAYDAISIMYWKSLSSDCDWLDISTDPHTDARRLTREPLWPRGAPDGWDATWQDAKTQLLSLYPTYQVWIDWYNRRIEGHDAAFDIPGDTDRSEDKAILVRLADATDEDFWDKGATYVNTTLQSWIDEARARVAPLPEQDPAAITYGVNDRGQLDRLPASDQKHLRDIPDQQFLYGRIRDAAFDLLGEGQRLGVPLARALNRFATAMPENFAAALALPIWAEGIILRRLYRAHRIAFESKELSSDQLEPVVAEGLGGLLDLYNHFAFGDDGLRAKDETTIPPQERASVASEAAAAAPIAAALLQTPEVATDIVIDDIMAEADVQPDGSPYDDQARDHTNRNWRNRVAAILTGLRNRMVNFGIKTGDATYGAIVGVVVTETALGQFVATNAQAFITYVSTAFPTYNLGWLIEKIARLFS